jgi:hypothetical protein
VEFELPEEAPRRGPLWLVAQGWVHPTDSSVNVAIGQGAAAKQWLFKAATCQGVPVDMIVGLSIEFRLH